MFMESRHAKGMFELQDGRLASRLVEAGFGIKDGERILFHPLEAAYVANSGKSGIAKKDAEKFICSLRKKDKGFPFAFKAYCTVRASGRLVRPFPKAPGCFRAYAPGVGREENRPSQLLCLLPGAAPSARAIGGLVKTAHLVRMELVIACGSEQDLRFYKISSLSFD